MMKFRFATEQDVEQMLLCHSQLMLPATAKDMRRGGLVLKPTQEGLLSCIKYGQVLLLEDLRLNTIAGFAIGFSDEAVRRSPYLRQLVIEGVKWNDLADAKQLVESKLGFIFNLGVLPIAAYKLYAPALALAIVKLLFEQNQYVLATLVHKPMENLASRTLLESVSALKIGDIEVENPMLGSITLALYCIERATFKARIENPEWRLPGATRVLRTIETLSRDREIWSVKDCKENKLYV